MRPLRAEHQHPVVVRLKGASLSPIAVAVRRGEDRRHVRRFVECAQTTAERDIDLLAGARLP